MTALFDRIPKVITQSAVVALVVGAVVLVLGLGQDQEYQGRVSLIAGPAAPADPASGPAAGYGEVVSLTLPALVELARSPSVVAAAAPVSGYTPAELAEHVSVELVPASGLARLSVRAPTEQQAGAAASAIGKAMIDANLLAPVGRLRLLDQRAEIIQIAPDRLLVGGLALASAAAAAVAAAAIRRLRTGRGRPDEEAVRLALSGRTTHNAVTILREDDPALSDRLTVLCRAANRPVRALAVTPELAERAAKLAAGIPGEDGAEPGTAVIAVTHAGRTRQGELTAAVGVLPASAVLVAVVLA